MAWKIVRKSDGEVVTCRGCKGQRWLNVIDTTMYRKYICEKCGSEHTQYVDPEVWSQLKSD